MRLKSSARSGGVRRRGIGSEFEHSVDDRVATSSSSYDAGALTARLTLAVTGVGKRWRGTRWLAGCFCIAAEMGRSSVKTYYVTRV